MSAAPSQTRMCNGALTMLGTSARIESINAGTRLAQAFQRVWDEAVRAMQAAHPWNPCVRRANATVDADYTVAGSQWAFAYRKPQGMLRWLPWAPGEVDFFDGEEESGRILTNAASPICVRGIFLVEDVALWTPGMETAMIAKLAELTAKAITGQSGMIDRMRDKFAEAIAAAKREDGLATGQRNRRAQVRSSWLDSRQSGTGWG